MNLEFKVYELNPEAKLYKMLEKMQKTIKNEFIIVGEEKVGESERYKVHQIEKKGLQLIGGLDIQEIAYSVPKADLKIKGDGIGIEAGIFDIPKEYLNMDIIEEIQRLNE